MMLMIRTSLYLTPEELKKLKEIAKENKTSVNSLIKQKILVKENIWDNVQIESVGEYILKRMRGK